jgi:acyl-CoA synthetase (AMP-forming)/AMP-acid ligase II
MHTKPECPPLDGSFLFPDIIDFHMQRNAPLPIYVFPDSQSGALTYISYLEFGRATHRIAHALRPGRIGAEGEVIAILVHTDTLLYTALIAGLMIAGFVVSTHPLHFTTLSFLIPSHFPCPLATHPTS